jgi:hypothetical protein
VEVHLGIAPNVIWEAVRLQSTRSGATVFCPHCESYFVFRPSSLTDEAANAGPQSGEESEQGEPQE